MIKKFFNLKGENNSDQSEKLRDIGNYLGLGLQLAVTVVVMVFIGIWLDKQFSTNPWLTITFSFLGIFAALYSFLKTVLKSKE
ncbi:MAG TPA: AtpZ/AtpI family protein [Ignavibacteriaceae bacterium]|nr:AtpZ/AtpI family protein [Ignavibacteriaceae bacterium]